MLAASSRARSSPLALALSPALLLAVCVLGYVIVVSVALYLKYEWFGQGYDQVDFEQAIWNTVQGRWFEDSRFNFTSSIFGMDFMPILLFFVPFYALLPSPHTLAVLQTLAIAAGSIPVYWLARERLHSDWAGLGFALAYLLYPTVEFVNLGPFQPRPFALTFLLFAIYFFEHRRFWAFAGMAALAMLCRTDVALVVAMFGVYALLARRQPIYVVVPLLAGAAYFVLALLVITPAMTFNGVDASRAMLETGIAGAQPGARSSFLLGYYSHLGATPGEIVRTVLLRPLDTARLVLTGPKAIYVLSLLLPLAFLPLLSPRVLVLALPILALNLLAERGSQINLRSHYQLLLVPALVVSSIYGADWLSRRMKGVPGGLLTRASVGLPALLLIVAAAANLYFRNPVISFALYHESPERVAAARALVARVPPRAAVAATSFLGPRLLPRRDIFNFPPASYSPPLDRADYLAIDRNGAATGLAEALREVEADPRWELVLDRENYALFQRVGR